MTFWAQTGAGMPIDPGEGVTPIMKELEPGRLRIIGTGFYITRYGLFVSAAHVFDDLRNADGEIGPAFVWTLPEAGKIHLRIIRSVSFLKEYDIGVGQADNFVESYPNDPLMNLRAQLTVAIPPVGQSVVTYAYPENEIMEFSAGAGAPLVRADYYGGKFLRHVVDDSNRFLPYPHFETSIRIKSGASGGPVFDNQGRVIGVNCRGWDFGEVDPDDNLSSIVPIAYLLQLAITPMFVPAISAEHRALAALGHRDQIHVSDLVDCNHVALV